MKTLVLITSHYPYGTGESFISTELSIISRNFTRIIIIAQDVSVEIPGEVPENATVYRYNPATSFKGFLAMPVLFLINSAVLTDMLKEEIEFRLGVKDHLTIRKFSVLFKKAIKAFQLKEFITKILKKEEISESIVFYSYWLKTGAHAVAMLKYRDSIRIARGHGSDIYEEKTDLGYLPLLKYAASNLDAIFFISNHGKQYFEEKINITTPRFMVSYLGVENPHAEINESKKSDKYTVVSCSNMVSLKRITLLIDSLELLKSEKEILWLHFGAGPLKNELESYAEKRLGKIQNIAWRFMGNYPNDKLLKYFSLNRIDLFLNTSSTEGLPVSIMEAQSFGIPVIATDTGGVKELVSKETGYLIPVDFSTSDLAKLIEHFITLPEDEENKIRMNAFLNWKSNFNASSNYEDFIIRLNSIFASSKEQRQY